MFDTTKPEWEASRQELRSLLDDAQLNQARRTTINAHYTDPAYVDAIWDGLKKLGFSGGVALEPGSGSGTFIGLAPDEARMVGVELDQTTAEISQALYPDATIRNESFVDTKYPSGFFDLAVGNVPFANVALHDPIDNANQHAMHNHFILKSLRLTRPGGIVAVLTSHFTLDAANPAARREMAAYADLVGAVRLPTGAHRRTAGTEAVTDLVIFRRRHDGEEPHDTYWTEVEPQMIDGELVRVNTYFGTRPDHVLGTLALGHGMHGTSTLQVNAPDLHATATRLRETLDDIAVSAHARGLAMTDRAEPAPTVEVEDVDLSAWHGSIHRRDDGTFVTRGEFGVEPLAVPKSAAVELSQLLRLRDLAARQLTMQQQHLDDTAEMVGGRAELLAAWQSYVTKYGPINRFNESETGRVDEDGDPIISRRMPTAIRLLRNDPFGPLVLALEVFDEDSQEATPAALLQTRVITPRPEKLGADTPAEALALSMNHSGTADLAYMAGLLGETPEATRALLGDLVYDDPERATLVPAAEYLSGHIYPKLDAAKLAAQHDEKYQSNVAALQAVLPAPLEPEEIQPRIGAVWISPEYHQQFLRELLNDQNATVTNPLPGHWQVRNATRYSIRATSEWGTQRRPAPDLFEQLANQSPIKVEDEIEDGDRVRKILNSVETTAAQAKGEELQQAFEEWVWTDPDRAASLAAEYNRRFNGIVLRDYSSAGDHLTFPGMTATFEMRDHQRAAVARMLSEPAVGLFHEVGAGKTAEMIAGSMELRRLGMANKIGVVVPNHMLEQFTREWLQLYPHARILAADSAALAGDKRRTFVARAAANDWDAVIMTRESFKRLAVEPETAAAYISDEVATYREALEKMNDGGDTRTVKRMEKALLSLEQTQEKLLAGERDPGVTFEATGLDYLVIDEMHDYKNLTTVSRIPGAAIMGSKRSTDLHMKLDYLRRRNGERVVTVATATPIANSVTEAHVMQRFLRPDLLRQAGVEAFDAWAATFGQTVSEMEMAPQGGNNFRQKTRFAKFQNVPDMLRMWHVFADVKTAEDLALPTPPLRERPDGRRVPVTIAIEPGQEVLDYVEHLGERADRVASRQVLPDEDNMLWISSDGRKAALDIRLVDPDAQPEHTPLDEISDNIARIHHEHANDRFMDTRTGEPSTRPGALQLVFCDLGTPPAKPNGKWNAYDQLKTNLIERGVPEHRIRFVHEAKNSREKAHLFSQAREGHISVLIGSTIKMGAGTNVQARAVALHDIDCPWKPAEVTQRHGRIERQGNQNPEIEIYQYVATGTFAAYMWQTIERKSKFINQIMRGSLDVREINDLGNDSLSAAEAKALASGNPLLLERSVAVNELTRIERLQRSYQRNQSMLRGRIRGAEERLPQLANTLNVLTRALPKAQDLSGDNFRMKVGTSYYDSRADAAEAIARWAYRTGVGTARPIIDDRDRGVIGSISGFAITARTHTDLGKVQLVLDLDGVPGATVRVDRTAATNINDIGIVRRLEHRTANIQALIDKVHTETAEVQQTLTDAQANFAKPFKHSEALQAAQAHLAAIDEQLHPTPDQPDAGPAADPYAPKPSDPIPPGGITGQGGISR